MKKDEVFAIVWLGFWFAVLLVWGVCMYIDYESVSIKEVFFYVCTLSFVMPMPIFRWRYIDWMKGK